MSRLRRIFGYMFEWPSIRLELTLRRGAALCWIAREQAGNAAMPAYTHLQPAEPVLVSHWLLAYIEMFLA